MKPSGKATASYALAAFLIVSLLLGCTYVSVDTRRYLAVPTFPPTDPAAVQILRAPPILPHERLGEISLEPQGKPSVQELEAKLRQAAAAMGADAAVLVADTTRLMGSWATGPGWGRQTSFVYGRVIIAIAIKYVG